MARIIENVGGDETVLGRTIVDVAQSGIMSDIDQVGTATVTADQNNYPLPPGQSLVTVVLFSTDASRNFTGFAGARPGFVVFCNTGGFDGVIVNDSALSVAENRVLCHTVADITLNPNESVLMFYDLSGMRWRTVPT